MEDIIKRIEAMTASNAIQQVLAGAEDGEYFFELGNGQKWSLFPEKESWYLHHYPTTKPLAELAALEGEAWQGFNDIVNYSIADMRSKSANQAASQLYQVLKQTK